MALSVSLYSCGCEDLNLGKLAFTNDLIAFLPAEPAQGQSYFALFNGTKHRMNYLAPNGISTVVIPVRKKNYSGKFDPNSCKEYYTAEEKVYTSQVEGGSPVSISITYRKDASQERFNNYIDKDNVADIIVFGLGYNNRFPAPIPSGSASIENYITQRYFIFKDASTSQVDNVTYLQEFLPAVTLNGITYQNVYHLHMKEQPVYRPEEQYYLEHYPQLDYVQGIYIKEGVGVMHAYTYKGKQMAITVE